MPTKKQSPAAPSSSGGSPIGLVVIAALVVLVAGAVGYALRPGAPDTPAPAIPAPSEAIAPPAAPLPAMSQAAPAGPVLPEGDATVAPVAAVTGGARLVADYSRLDFGNKDYQEPVNAEFTITNVGDAPLQIADVSVQTRAG
jgi:hypothetical protein